MVQLAEPTARRALATRLKVGMLSGSRSSLPRPPVAPLRPARTILLLQPVPRYGRCDDRLQRSRTPDPPGQARPRWIFGLRACPQNRCPDSDRAESRSGDSHAGNARLNRQAGSEQRSSHSAPPRRQDSRRNVPSSSSRLVSRHPPQRKSHSPARAFAPRSRGQPCFMSAQHVTHPRFRYKVARSARIALDLPPHPPHVHPRQSAGRPRTPAPRPPPPAEPV